jgi:hypothetical protein
MTLAEFSAHCSLAGAEKVFSDLPDCNRIIAKAHDGRGREFIREIPIQRKSP